MNGGDSTLMNGEYAEEAEISVFSDDDVSSHSSVAAVAPSLEASSCIPVEPVEVLVFSSILLSIAYRFFFYNNYIN